jgi:hypothetical protein
LRLPRLRLLQLRLRLMLMLVLPARLLLVREAIQRLGGGTRRQACSAQKRRRSAA